MSNALAVNAAQLGKPAYAVAPDSFDSRFVAGSDNPCIRRAGEALGFITTVAGAGDVPGIEVPGAVVLAVLLGTAIVFVRLPEGLVETLLERGLYGSRRSRFPGRGISWR